MGLGTGVAVVDAPFRHDIYLIAAVLDPRHQLKWVLDEDCKANIVLKVAEAAKAGK